MCKPKNQGGRRCAAHTRPAFHDAIARIRSAKTTTQLDTAEFDGYADVASHAATPTGGREVRALRNAALDQADDAMASYLEACLTMANGMRHAYARIDEEVRARTNTRAPLSGSSGAE